MTIWSANSPKNTRNIGESQMGYIGKTKDPDDGMSEKNGGVATTNERKRTRKEQRDTNKQTREHETRTTCESNPIRTLQSQTNQRTCCEAAVQL